MTPDPKPTEALKPLDWISVKDQLPEHGQLVLCKYEGVYDSRRVTFWRDAVNNHFGLPSEVDGKGSQPATHWKAVPDTHATDRDAELAALREALTIAMRQWRGYAQECSQEDVEDEAHEEGQLYRFCQSALASTAGTELLERLRKAEEMVFNLTQKLGAADAASVKADVDIEHYRQRLTAVTAERDEARAQFERYSGWSNWKEGLWLIAHSEGVHSATFIAKDLPAAAKSESAGLRKERDELQEILRQIPNT